MLAMCENGERAITTLSVAQMSKVVRDGFVDPQVYTEGVLIGGKNVQPPTAPD